MRLGTIWGGCGTEVAASPFEESSEWCDTVALISWVCDENSFQRSGLLVPKVKNIITFRAE